MNNQKNELKNKLTDVLMNAGTGMTEAKIRKIAADLSEVANEHVMESQTEFQQTFQQLTLDYEVLRSSFKKHIEYLETQSKKVIGHLRENSIVTVQYNMTSGKQEVRSTSRMAALIVEYFNTMDKEVIGYYKDVFKPEKSENTGGFIQGSFF